MTLIGGLLELTGSTVVLVFDSVFGLVFGSGLLCECVCFYRRDRWGMTMGCGLLKMSSHASPGQCVSWQTKSRLFLVSSKVSIFWLLFVIFRYLCYRIVTIILSFFPDLKPLICFSPQPSFCSNYPENLFAWHFDSSLNTHSAFSC